MKSLAYLGFLLAALLAAGCANSGQSLLIAGNYAEISPACGPPTVQSLMNVVVLADGIYDVGIAALTGVDYLMFPLVTNELPSSTGVGGVQLNNLQLTGATVTITPDPGQAITAFLPPGVAGLTSITANEFGGLLTAAGGQAVLPITAIPNKVAQTVAGRIKPGGTDVQTVTLQVTVTADQGGPTVTSNTVNFPVSFCSYCLVQSPDIPGATAYDPTATTAVKLEACPMGDVAKANIKSTCLPGQDTPSSACVTTANGAPQILFGDDIPNM